MRILRYALKGEGDTLYLQKGARVLSAAVKPGQSHVSLWALCPNVAETEPRHFRIVGTGWDTELPPDATFIATTLMQLSPSGTTLVWHVF